MIRTCPGKTTPAKIARRIGYEAQEPVREGIAPRRSFSSELTDIGLLRERVSSWGRRERLVTAATVSGSDRDLVVAFVAVRPPIGE
ncbi:hypothetical protein MKZ38_002287 [Zalerion maritima]|uniref:Uncharacterized protein n=1 Tax=Zalerion maritima TaxID=339359 RepID=A0AAD5RPU1_9PEZI|nr:hypothetical protein MKZ38_002287 [Zalerion maritima]